MHNKLMSRQVKPICTGTLLTSWTSVSAIVHWDLWCLRLLAIQMHSWIHTSQQIKLLISLHLSICNSLSFNPLHSRHLMEAIQVHNSSIHACTMITHILMELLIHLVCMVPLLEDKTSVIVSNVKCNSNSIIIWEEQLICILRLQLTITWWIAKIKLGSIMHPTLIILACMNLIQTLKVLRLIRNRNHVHKIWKLQMESRSMNVQAHMIRTKPVVFIRHLVAQMTIRITNNVTCQRENMIRTKIVQDLKIVTKDFRVSLKAKQAMACQD